MLLTLSTTLSYAVNTLYNINICLLMYAVNTLYNINICLLMYAVKTLYNINICLLMLTLSTTTTTTLHFTSEARFDGAKAKFYRKFTMFSAIMTLLTLYTVL